jgi:putative CocE/NonD family hydrolase
MSTPSHLRDVRVLVHEPVTMRDGVKLATTVYLPLKTNRYPVLLVRSAYNRFVSANELKLDGEDLARRDIALVVQDCRGRYGSNGEFYPFAHETHDGLDTLDWIAQQPWCNGRITMTGDSYLAATQFAVAAHNHPAVCALNPRFMAGDLWRHAYYNDGVFSLALTFSWLCFECGGRTSDAALFPLFNVGELLRHLPLGTLDEKAGCGEQRVFREYLTHETRDDFWKNLNYREQLSQAEAPILLTGGWYDNYASETFHNFAALQKSPAASQHRVIIGPWAHGINAASTLGELDFGDAALAENDSSSRWMECLLKDGSPADFQQAPIRLFVMGLNQWRDEREWPLARTQWTEYFLRPNGVLSPQSAQQAAPDSYIYDPQNPTPTRGGNHSVGPYNPGLYELALPGPYDQRPIEARDDVLVYTTSPLTEDVEITGPIVLKLFASCSTPDTDFVARLCDVYPDGRSINLTEGVLRARFHSGDWEHPQRLVPGQIYELTIDLHVTSNVFFKGHRIRLDITSSNFPLWDRNLNTGESIATGVEWQSAQITVYHGTQYPSHLILPIIPNKTNHQ